MSRLSTTDVSDLEQLFLNKKFQEAPGLSSRQNKLLHCMASSTSSSSNLKIHFIFFKTGQATKTFKV